MRKHFFLTLLSAFSAILSAQNASPDMVRRHIQHLLDEKLRVHDADVLQDLLYQQLTGAAHPTLPHPAGGKPANDRSGETVVHDDDLAESEIHAAINPVDSNNVIVAAIRQEPDNLFAPLSVPVFYSKNFGQSWQSSSITFNPVPGNGFAAGGGDPVLAFDKSGKAYLSWLVLTLGFGTPPIKLTLYLSTSSDQGKTWSTPVQVDQGTADIEILSGGGSGTLVDKQWMATDRSTSAYEGNLYVSYTRLEIIDSTTANASILVKTRNKTTGTFGPAVTVSQGMYEIVQFSSIDVDRQGNVHVLFFGGSNADGLALYHALSTDGGATFQAETPVSSIYFPSLTGEATTDTIRGIATARLYPCPHLKAGLTPGTVFATWSASGLNGPETPGFDVWLAKSTDNGQTWNTPTRIFPGPNPAAHQYYSALNVSPKGVLSLSYYDRSADPTGTNTHYVMTYSTDGGATFRPVRNASSMASDFAQIGSLNAGFGIGEYTQVVNTDYYAIPVWADGRANNGDIDVYAAVLPLFEDVSGTGELGTVTDAFSVNAPSPAAGQIRLDVQLNQHSPLSIRVFSADGRVVFADTNAKAQSPGLYTREVRLPAGTYVCMVETGFGFRTRRVVVQ